jgi:hypothetical protein
LFKTQDDVKDWNEYAETLFWCMNSGQEHADIYLNDDFKIENGRLIHNKRLHENYAEIYSQVVALDCKNVFECGAGAGIHLHNIAKIIGEENVFGADINPHGLLLGEKMFNLSPIIKSHITICDFSNPDNRVLFTNQKYDLVYTQAVTMHLSDENTYYFLINMDYICNKYILLIENTTQHNYDKLIKHALPNYKIHRDLFYKKDCYLLEKI